MIYALIILAILANVTMDEIDHHWGRWFGKVIKKEGWINWMNPRLSWPNKKHENRFIQFMLSIPLVMITDFWHFLKFVFLNCIFGIIILLTDWIWEWMIIFNLGWGVLFIFFLGFYGMLSDKYHD